MPWREPDAPENNGLGHDLPNRQHARIGDYEERMAQLAFKWVMPPIVLFVVWWHIGFWFFDANGLMFSFAVTLITTGVIYFIYWLKPRDIRWLEIRFE